MGRKIVIKLEGEDLVVDEMVRNIEATTIGQIGAHEIEGYKFYKEILPEKISTGINLPGFINGRKDVGQNG